IVNECDRMALPCETVWLDGLEKLPAMTVVLFSTNDKSRLSDRFRHRCEEVQFRSAHGHLKPWIKALAQRVWELEGGVGDCPGLDRLGVPTLGGPDGMPDYSAGSASFRLALQQLQPIIRAHLQSRHASE